MDIQIEIDECGGVRFSACPEEILEIARSLDPENQALRWRAALLSNASKGVRRQHGSDQEDDEC